MLLIITLNKKVILKNQINNKKKPLQTKMIKVANKKIILNNKQMPKILKKALNNKPNKKIMNLQNNLKKLPKIF